MPFYLKRTESEKPVSLLALAARHRDAWTKNTRQIATCNANGARVFYSQQRCTKCGLKFGELILILRIVIEQRRCRYVFTTTTKNCSQFGLTFAQISASHKRHCHRNIDSIGRAGQIRFTSILNSILSFFRMRPELLLRRWNSKIWMNMQSSRQINPFTNWSNLSATDLWSSDPCNFSADSNWQVALHERDKERDQSKENKKKNDYLIFFSFTHNIQYRVTLASCAPAHVPAESSENLFFQTIAYA